MNAANHESPKQITIDITIDESFSMMNHDFLSLNSWLLGIQRPHTATTTMTPSRNFHRGPPLIPVRSEPSSSGSDGSEVAITQRHGREDLKRWRRASDASDATVDVHGPWPGKWSKKAIR